MFRNLEGLSPHLNSVLRGQEEAIEDFSRAVRLGWEGPARDNRPRMFVILLGPTGTGKTEMCVQTSEFLYGEQAEETNFARFDCAEYQHPDAIKRLLGDGLQKPLLGEAIDNLNKNGGGLLLFDEIEKAHKELVKALLSFDSARSTMNDGETKNLERIGVVLTSNLGSKEAAQMRKSPDASIRNHILRSAERYFSPEVFARFTARIVMRKLSYDVQFQIAENLLKKELRLQSAHVQRDLELAGTEVLRLLVRRGFTDVLGARPVRAMIESTIGAALLPYVHDMPDPTKIESRLSRALILDVEEEKVVARPVLRSWAMMHGLGLPIPPDMPEPEPQPVAEEDQTRAA